MNKPNNKARLKAFFLRLTCWLSLVTQYLMSQGISFKNLLNLARNITNEMWSGRYLLLGRSKSAKAILLSDLISFGSKIFPILGKTSFGNALLPFCLRRFFMWGENEYMVVLDKN